MAENRNLGNPVGKEMELDGSSSSGSSARPRVANEDILKPSMEKKDPPNPGSRDKEEVDLEDERLTDESIREIRNRILIYKKKLNVEDIRSRLCIPVNGLHLRLKENYEGVGTYVDKSKQYYKLKKRFGEEGFLHILYGPDWNRFVKENNLRPNDTILFYRIRDLPNIKIEIEKCQPAAGEMSF